MLRDDLLQEELKNYKERYGVELKPIRYNRNVIFNLFRKYKNWGSTVCSYCCYGEEQCCWYDPFEEGIWDLSLQRVREIILAHFKGTKHITRSIRKYKHRMYIYQDKDRCYIYIYCRDLFHADYHIWFNNKNN